MDNIFPGLSFIIAIAAIVALAMRIIGQPLIIGYIITGIIVGPAVLNVANSPETLDLFSNIGIALLLFIVGLGLNPKAIKEVGKNSAVVGTLQVILITAVSFVGGRMLGLNNNESLFFGASLAFSSTIIVLKLIGDKKEQGRLYGKMAVGILLVQDIIAIALVLLTSSGDNQTLDFGSLITLALKAGAITWLIYWASTRVLPKFHNLIASNQEFLFLFAIAWGLGSAALFNKIGLSTEIGALLAGVCLSSMPSAQEIGAKLRPLRDFFLIVFFISLGSNVDTQAIQGHLGLIIFGLIMAILVKPIVTMAILGFMGYTKRTSFSTAISIGQVSEFSVVLILLALSKGLILGDLVSSIVLIALISIAASTYTMVFNDKLYKIFERRLGMFERRKGIADPAIEADYELVLFGYQRGGHEFVNLFKKLKKKYVVIDYDPEIIDILESKKINYLYGDATDSELLEEAGVNRAKLVVSTIPDFEINKFLLSYLEQKNPDAVIILHGDDPSEAAKLYEHGATYVILPHYIGSEKVSTFIGKSGLSKHAFKIERERHLVYLEKHYGTMAKTQTKEEQTLGQSIVNSVTALAKPKS